MFKCPNCKELISENMIACPFCRHEISAAERTQAEKEIRDEEEKENREMLIKIQAAARARKICFACMVIYIILYILVAGFLGLMGLEYAAAMVCLVGVFLFMAIFAFIMFFTKIFACPHCGKILYRNYGPYCHSCGGPL